MSNIFEDITISWQGAAYKVPHDKVLRLIAVVEDHIRINQLVSEKGPALAQLSFAYAAALRFAGASVSDEQVYQAFFTEGPEVATTLVAALLSMMVPPSSLKDDSKKKQ